MPTVQEELKDMRVRGIIEPSDSSRSAPLVHVKMKESPRDSVWISDTHQMP